MLQKEKKKKIRISEVGGKKPCLKIMPLKILTMSIPRVIDFTFWEMVYLCNVTSPGSLPSERKEIVQKSQTSW